MTEGWKPNEDTLREREVAANETAVETQARSNKIGRWLAIGALLTAGAALVVAGLTVQAVNVAKDGVETARQTAAQQRTESRLDTAIAAIGSGASAQRIGGLHLLRRLSTAELDDAETERERRDAASLYRAATRVMGLYLYESHSSNGKDRFFAGGELKLLLQDGEASGVFGDDPGKEAAPSIDLAGVDLHGMSWKDINFSWLGSAVLSDIELRCSNLTNARMGKVTLIGADLRGADVTGADFTDANLDSALLDGVIYTGPRPPGLPDVAPMDPHERNERCRSGAEYGRDNNSTVGS